MAKTSEQKAEREDAAEGSPIIEVRKTTLEEAIKLVGRAITERENELHRIANTDDQPPITLWGRTCRGYEVQAMADPKDVASILERYDYAIYDVLKLDLPEAIWGELADLAGLEAVSGFDL